MKRTVFILLCAITFINAQNILPFASQNNIIELSVANVATVDAGNVTVEVQNAPQWLTFKNPRQTEGGQVKTQIANLKSREASTSSFTFSVGKSAPINKPHTLKFIISSPTGEKWTKEIAIQISAPEKFELFQNYPNPFNPTTTIEYTMPISGNVVLKVYDAIGREVVTLFEGVKEAGFHQQVWNAYTVASGMYIYQLAYKNQKGELEFYRKKMLLTK